MADLTVGGITYDSSCFDYKYDEKNKKHVFTSKYGLSIMCPSQRVKNKADLYLLSSHAGEMVGLTNISNAKVENSQNDKCFNINLIGCNECMVDVSKNNKTDYIQMFSSEKFASRNNLIKSSGEDCYIAGDEIESCIPLGKGVYSESKLNEQANENWLLSLWHSITNWAKVSD